MSATHVLVAVCCALVCACSSGSPRTQQRETVASTSGQGNDDQDEGLFIDEQTVNGMRLLVCRVRVQAEGDDPGGADHQAAAAAVARQAIVRYLNRETSKATLSSLEVGSMRVHETLLEITYRMPLPPLSPPSATPTNRATPSSVVPATPGNTPRVERARTDF